MTGVETKAGVVTMMLPERVDSATSASVERVISDALHPGARLIVDGSAVNYMSAAGVRALATVLHRAEELDAHIVFSRFSGTAADCLVVSGFTQLFDVADSREEAESRLAGKASKPSVERLHPRRTAG